MPRLANSAVQLRTKETKAAFVAEYAPKPGMPICHAADPERMIDALSVEQRKRLLHREVRPACVQVEVLVKRFWRRFCE